MLNKICFAILGAASILVSHPSAEADIPNSRTIVSRMVRNNGKGVYVLEQDVIFRSTTESLTLREKWLVENGETLRLTVTSGKGGTEAFRFEAVYREGRRTASDLQGGLKTTNLSPEFLEVLSHARSTNGFLGALYRARIVPSSFLSFKRSVDLKTNKRPSEPLVRLGPSGGVVTWIFGEPTPVEAKRLNPAAWISQDDFQLRRVRFPSEAEISLGKYSVFAGSLRFPRERTLTWDSNSVFIRVVSVKTLPAGPQLSAQLMPNSLTTADAKAARLPDISQVKEFYSRFR